MKNVINEGEQLDLNKQEGNLKKDLYNFVEKKLKNNKKFKFVSNNNLTFTIKNNDLYIFFDYKICGESKFEAINFYNQKEQYELEDLQKGVVEIDEKERKKINKSIEQATKFLNKNCNLNIMLFSNDL